jgi:hypothetical protein
MVAPHPMASFVAHLMTHADEPVRRNPKVRKVRKARTGTTTLPAPALTRQPIPEPAPEPVPAPMAAPVPAAVPAIVRALQPVIPAIPRQIDLERARRIRA